MENPDERVEGQVQEGDDADPMAELGNQNRPTDPPRERQDEERFEEALQEETILVETVGEPEDEDEVEPQFERPPQLERQDTQESREDVTFGFGRDLSMIQQEFMETNIAAPPRERPHGLAPLVVATPRRKGFRELVSSAIRQSMGKAKTAKDNDDDLSIQEDEASEMELKTEGDRFVIGGRPITLRASPRSEDDCGVVRLWDKKLDLS